MQIVNNFSTTLQSDSSTARKQLLPKPLNITPLGASMGLIQWVDHTMPLYGVYKAWQHRQIADKAGMHTLNNLELLGVSSVQSILPIWPFRHGNVSQEQAGRRYCHS